MQVLPFIDVVKGDAFNSHPTDTKRMGPSALERVAAGEALPSEQMRTPLVELPLGATEDRICGALHLCYRTREAGPSANTISPLGSSQPYRATVHSRLCR